jgi:hypothetical protein
MKGQLVFEFLVAGFIFFAILVYTINYLNVNVSDYRNNFYQNWLQSKAIQISDILLKGESTLSLSSGQELNMTKIQLFNADYCPLQNGSYSKLIDDFYLYEKTNFGDVVSKDVIIQLSSPSGMLIDCRSKVGMFPSNITKAEIGRVGIIGSTKEIAKLRVIVW